VRVFVNGKATLEVPVNAKEKALFLEVPLVSGANNITVHAYDERGFSSNPPLCKCGLGADGSRETQPLCPLDWGEPLSETAPR
jgi:hypothetical protein